LAALEPGDKAQVQSVPDGDGELLRYLVSLALIPGQTVTLLQAAPFSGPLTLRIDRHEAAISAELAAQIRVAALEVISD
jgi:DtxR family Mn-dependent transcriptional regulator